MNRIIVGRSWLPLVACLGFCALAALTGRAHAEPVSQLQVRIETGGADLVPGSYVELRIYELGGRVRKLPLTHGEGWQHDSTRIIPLALGEPLDARRVVRFSLYYRAAHLVAPAWSVVAADVDLAAGHGPPQLLLGSMLSGEIRGQGELATSVRDASTLTCISDADCDDGRSCNGVEHCAPRAAGADERGCVHGKPVVCPVNQVCSEAHGCVGASAFAPKSTAASPAGSAAVPVAGAGAGAGAPGADAAR